MSGHNKWSTIKRKKEKVDAQRGRVFTRLIKEITIAARLGGGDPDSNARLRTAVLSAKTQNMPADNITRAIKKGTGELPGVNYEEVLFEGYGPGGTAIMVETLTDNKNRTLPEIRHIFSKYNGNLGTSNSVAWIFSKKGLIQIPANASTEDDLLEILLEADVEDIQLEDEFFSITLPPNQFENAKELLTQKSIPISHSELSMVPQNTKKLEGREAESMLKLMDALEEQDDVQNVYSNFDIDDDALMQD
ncbi:MAG: YebC/PmpR family DNA-binding transcriptional regulator [Candidatus Delongbacteria bacterium]|nr:YebC/PmpR family DNA-binding transcriptional regulator [Candidatus Delongbacteria bacterium]